MNSGVWVGKEWNTPVGWWDPFAGKGNAQNRAESRVSKEAQLDWGWTLVGPMLRSTDSKTFSNLESSIEEVLGWAEGDWEKYQVWTILIDWSSISARFDQGGGLVWPQVQPNDINIKRKMCSSHCISYLPFIACYWCGWWLLQWDNTVYLGWVNNLWISVCGLYFMYIDDPRCSGEYGWREAHKRNSYPIEVGGA